VLTIADDAEHVGQGEASPLAGSFRETLDACREALARVHEHLGRLDLARGPIEAVSAAIAPIDGHLAALPSARLALETALFDLAGKRLGLSVAACLAGASPTWPVPLGGLVPLVDDAPRRGRALLDRGLRVLKIKLGLCRFDAELTSLEALRRALPDLSRCVSARLAGC
jgi:L-alanine-DL-glutamate epimerase-like enolase superfamily enzyme